MKKNITKQLLFVVLFSVGFLNAQTKKWSLEDCVAYAIKNNISVQQTMLDLNTSSVDVKAAVGDFLPSLNLTGSHSWNIGLNPNITTGLLQNQTTQYSSVALSSNVTLFNGLQAQNKLRRANLALIGAQYKLSKIQEDVALNVANAYLQILFNKEQLKVQQQQLTNNQRQLIRAQELVKAGSVPRGDLLDLKATVANNEQAIIRAENALLISKLSLAQLLQINDFQNFDITEENQMSIQSSVLAESPKTIIDKAKEVRVELKIAKNNLLIAEKDMKIARGAYQPSIIGFYNLSARASYSDRIVGVDANGMPITAPPLSTFTQFDKNKGHSFGAQINIPIFNGFGVSNNVARTKINLERSKLALQQQELDVERNVFTAFTDAKGALNAYESALIALQAREEAYLYAKEKNAVGMLNSFDLSQSQVLFANAQSEVLRTKYDYIFRIKILEFYFGIPIIKN